MLVMAKSDPKLNARRFHRQRYGVTQGAPEVSDETRVFDGVAEIRSFMKDARFTLKMQREIADLLLQDIQDEMAEDSLSWCDSLQPWNRD